jgi:hypothetical protein
VTSLIIHVNCTEKYAAINQRQLGVGSGPIDVQFASGGQCSFGKEGMDYVICSVIFHPNITLHLTQSTADGSSRIVAVQEGWRWKKSCQ